MIKLLIGGSPCTHWSIAQKNNRETQPIGEGWELFKNYLIALEKYRPDYFLYENNKSAAKPIKDMISKKLGVPLQYINSALVSAQNRERFYGHNIPGVPQPFDRGILLRDVLETGTCWRDKGYTIDANYYKTLGNRGFETQSGRRKMVAEPVAMRQTGRRVGADGKRHDDDTSLSHEQRFEVNQDPQKTNCVSTVAKDNMIAEPLRSIDPVIYQKPHGYNNGGIKYDKAPALTANGRWDQNNFAVEWWDGKTYPVYEVTAGIITIKDKPYPIKLPDGLYIIRKLTVTECKRLQTVPDSYTMPCSNTQSYKMLGNGWTVDAIAHILSHIPNIQNEPVEVLSMYDGMSCGHIALDKVGANVARYYATEIDKYAIETTMANYPGTIQLGDAYQVRDDGWAIEEQLRIAI